MQVYNDMKNETLDQNRIRGLQVQLLAEGMTLFSGTVERRNQGIEVWMREDSTLDRLSSRS